MVMGDALPRAGSVRFAQSHGRVFHGRDRGSSHNSSCVCELNGLDFEKVRSPG